MISDRRVTEIEHYFYRDHVARRRNFSLAVVTGTIAFLFCRLIESSTAELSFIIGTAASVVAFFIYLVAYHPLPLKAGSRSSAWRRSEITPAPQMLEARRSVLVGIPAFVVAALIAIFAPNLSEAEAANKRIRRLLDEGRRSEAKDAAQDAINAGIPLKPEVVSSVGTPGFVTKDGALDLSNGTFLTDNSGHHRALIALNDGQQLSIWLPLVYVPPGRYRIASGTIHGLLVSFVGDGPNKTSLLCDFGEAAPFRALLEYSMSGAPDILICGFTITPKTEQERNRGYFLTVSVRPSKVAVSNLVIQSMCQTLDRIIWSQTSFVGCKIICAGDWFDLSNVTFTDCQFDFAGEIPEGIRNRLRGSRSQGLSMTFRR